MGILEATSTKFRVAKIRSKSVWFVSYTVSKLGYQKLIDISSAKKKFENDNLNCQKWQFELSKIHNLKCHSNAKNQLSITRVCSVQLIDVWCVVLRCVVKMAMASMMYWHCIVRFEVHFDAFLCRIFILWFYFLSKTNFRLTTLIFR